MHLRHIDILPQKHTSKRQRHESRTANNHVPLNISISMHNASASGSSPSVRKLHLDVSVNCSSISLVIFGEVLDQEVEELVGPDGPRDGAADGATDRGGQADQGQHYADLVVLDHGHDGQLLADDDRAGGYGLEDLAHDDVADVGVGGAEVDEETGGEAGDGDGGAGDPLVVVGLADETMDVG